MNLHKAKGLEAPVVFLADAAGDFTFPIVLRVVRTGDRALGHLRVARPGKYGRAVTIGQPRGWAALEEEEAKYVAAERLRQLYVAGTRAKELLIVCRSAKGGDNKAWAEFEGFLARAPEIGGALAAVPAKADEAVSADARAEAAARRQAARDRILRASWDVTSVTTAKGNGDEGPTNENEEEGADAAGERLERGHARRIDAGPAWGSLIHGLLEHVGHHREATGADLERLARWLTVETPELRPAIGSALDLVEQVRHAPFWDGARAGGDLHAEVPFAIAIPAGQSVGGVSAGSVPAVLRGVIDLVYRAGGGWRILDYKTDLATEHLDRHSPQLAAYRAAWEHVTSEAVVEAAVIGIR